MESGANTLINQKNYSDDLKTAMDYITENGTSILNGTAIEIAD
jgi:hypothetical protein